MVPYTWCSLSEPPVLSLNTKGMTSAPWGWERQQEYRPRLRSFLGVPGLRGVVANYQGALPGRQKDLVSWVMLDEPWYPVSPTQSLQVVSSGNRLFEDKAGNVTWSVLEHEYLRKKVLGWTLPKAPWPFLPLRDANLQGTC